MSKRPLIWLTRPAADSAALADTLAEHRIHSIVAPVMQIVPCDTAIDLSSKPDAVLITSRHATPMLHQLPEAWRTVPVFAVGLATADAVRAASFIHVTHGTGDVLALLPQLTTALPSGSRVLYLAGEHTQVDVHGLLGLQGIHVVQQVAYRALEESSLPTELLDALFTHQLTGVAFFSPRSASLAIELLHRHAQDQSVSTVDAFCLSLPIAQAAARLSWSGLHACHVPTREAMVELIVSRAGKDVI